MECVFLHECWMNDDNDKNIDNLEEDNNSFLNKGHCTQ